MIDSTGAYGFYLHYACLFLFLIGALSVFIYLACKGRLDMNEDPKYHVFDEELEDERGNSSDR